MGNLRRPDVVVTGTGRSGTSFTAFILNRCYGVCLGATNCPKDQITTEDAGGLSPRHKKGGSKFRWGGSNEDRRIQQITHKLIKGTATAQEWLRTFSNAHSSCGARLIGCKTPLLIWMNEEFWDVVAPRLVINCARSKEQVIKSHKRWSPTLKWGDDKYNRYLRIRDNILKRLPTYVELDFTGERTPKWVADQLAPYITELTQG